MQHSSADRTWIVYPITPENFELACLLSSVEDPNIYPPCSICIKKKVNILESPATELNMTYKQRTNRKDPKVGSLILEIFHFYSQYEYAMITSL